MIRTLPFISYRLYLEQSTTSLRLPIQGAAGHIVLSACSRINIYILTPVAILPICEGGGLPVLVPGALIAVDSPAALMPPAVPSALVPG